MRSLVSAVGGREGLSPADGHVLVRQPRRIIASGRERGRESVRSTRASSDGRTSVEASKEGSEDGRHRTGCCRCLGLL